ncbi:MAG TPA: DUF6264 family protein [Agromyces sp.]|nr:DUF6264 family protein [Agromyces sp.]
MSQHAAGAPDESADRPTADGVPAVPPTGEPAGGTRPRPQYGEYAPEGWTWQPPAGEHTSDPAPQMETPKAAASVEERPDRPADRIVTIVLLVLGVLGVWSAITSLATLPTLLPEALRQTAEVMGTGGEPFDYTPRPEVPGLILAGQVIQVVLWLLTAWWAITRIRARKLAFWVPLVGGALSFIALYAIIFTIMISDPVLVERLSVG